MRLKIAPSILSADFARLADQVREVEKAGADQIHVDVMDGHFVPNLSMGPLVVEALRRVTTLPLDVHLMITDPGRYLDAFLDAGADHVSVHLESEGNLKEMAARLRKREVGAGLVLNPDTPADRALEWLPVFDMVLIMTVHPGFGGQSFLRENLEKIRLLRAAEQTLRKQGKIEKELDVEVDGGIDLASAREACRAGANVFVAGSSIFRQSSPAEAVRALRQAVLMDGGAADGGAADRTAKSGAPRAASGTVGSERTA